MGQLYPATPKIYNFPPPNPPSSKQNHPFEIWSHDCLHPALLHIPALSHSPALPSGSLGMSTTHPKDHISHPNQPRLPGKYPRLQVFWVVGFCPYTLMQYVRLSPIIDTWDQHIQVTELCKRPLDFYSFILEIQETLERKSTN